MYGDGAGVVVLKRLADALADGDTIHAVIRGSAVNNDGAVKVGFAAPSVAGLRDVATRALQDAEVAPETLSYVEAHGTGTPLGDPIEVAALTQALAPSANRAACPLGSVKTNIGHLDRAAGVSGLIKTALALEHREIPATLHFNTPNPQIDFAGGPFFVARAARPWPRIAGRPRLAGVNSLGVGGTNAHVIVEEAPEAVAGGQSRAQQLLVLSARSAPALEAQAQRLAARLEAEPGLALADVAYTLAVGRRQFEHRQVVIVLGCGGGVLSTSAGRRPRSDRSDDAVSRLRSPGMPGAADAADSLAMQEPR